MVIENRPSKMKFFWCQGIFFVNFDFENVCKNEFEDNNEKSCSRFKTPDSLGVNIVINDY